ncbi:MAG: gamma carbonic anhydrase family protein, partial [Bacilli bacterium]
MKVIDYLNYKPIIDQSVFLQEGVCIEGQVEIKAGSSVWFNTTIRGDLSKITIGENTNIQELTSIHGDFNQDVLIGDMVTIGHQCIIHGACVN